MSIEKEINRLEETLEKAEEDLEQANEAVRLALVEQTSAREALTETKGKLDRLKSLVLAARAYDLAFELNNNLTLEPGFSGEPCCKAFDAAKSILVRIDRKIGVATHEAILDRSEWSVKDIATIWVEMTDKARE